MSNKDLTGTDETIMHFGKHAGCRLKEVPAGYLDWLIANGDLLKSVKLYNYIIKSKTAIDQEIDDTEEPPY